MKPTFIIIFIVMFILGCKPKLVEKQQSIQNVEVNPVLKQYAGKYEVYIKELGITDDSESFTLYESGLAEWKWFERKSGHVNSVKSGIWSADKKLLKITIEGNTGRINENFMIENGKIHNNSRTLRKIQM